MERRFERAVAVRVLKPYVLDVTFDDGFGREVDIEPLSWGEVFRPLRDPARFAQATVDPAWGSVAWPTGADLAPEFLSCGEETPYGRIETEMPKEVASAMRSTP